MKEPRRHRPRPASIGCRPWPCGRAISANLRDSQGRLCTLYDPWSTAANWSRQPFAYGGKLNVIDPARMSPTAKYLFSVTRVPTNASTR